MLCCTMLCYTMLCYAILCYTMLYYAILCDRMLCCTMLCYTMLQKRLNVLCTGPVNAMFTIDQDTSWSAATATSNYVYASFPVDVIVYFHMQPSTFRFSCLPVSRVECMLQLPSLDIVFSSKRAEEELHRWVLKKTYLWENKYGGVNMQLAAWDYCICPKYRHLRGYTILELRKLNLRYTCP